MPTVTYDDCTACCPPPGGGVTVGCCAFEIPTTLNVTLSNIVGSCPCISTSYALSWNGSSWEAAAQCTMSTPITLVCTGNTASDWALSYDASDIISFVSGSCNPLALVFNASFDSGATCNGSMTATITITE